MKLTLVLVAGLVLATLGFTIAPRAAQAQAGSVYAVQTGDTASSIAARYCMSMQELAGLNGWDQTKINQIYPNMQVQVVNHCGGNGGGNWNPGGDANWYPNPNPNWTCGGGGFYDGGPRPHATGYLYGSTYIVAFGDTSFSIAQRFGISVNALAAANRIDPWRIYGGQRLYIPAGGGRCQPQPACNQYNNWCQPQPCYNNWCQPQPCSGYWCQQPCYGYGCPYYGQAPVYSIPVTPTP